GPLGDHLGRLDFLDLLPDAPEPQGLQAVAKRRADIVVRQLAERQRAYDAPALRIVLDANDRLVHLRLAALAPPLQDQRDQPARARLRSSLVRGGPFARLPSTVTPRSEGACRTRAVQASGPRERLNVSGSSPSGTLPTRTASPAPTNRSSVRSAARTPAASGSN